MPTRLLFARTFLAAFAVTLLYFAVAYWRMEDPFLQLPGLLIISGSMPWPSVWLDHALELRNVISIVLIPAAFSVNAAIVISSLVTLFHMTAGMSDPRRSVA